jgi:anti-sigma B factor antagonist
MSPHGHVIPRQTAAVHLKGLPAPPQGTDPQPPEPFDVEIRPSRARVVVAPRGELDLATTDRVDEAMDELVGSGFAEIVLDLRALTFMDSTGLRLVIRQALRQDATVRIIDGTGPVARLFDLTGVRSRLPFLSAREVLRTR